ncbi:MAG: hypothetical protein F4X30_02650 [Acidimicrobiaceae bacterium]|nr:hypothetical protein [Acidimicrobiaceae bacterium]
MSANHDQRNGVLTTWIRQLPTVQGSDLDGTGAPAEDGVLAEASQGDDDGGEDLAAGRAEALSG